MITSGFNTRGWKAGVIKGIFGGINLSDRSGMRATTRKTSREDQDDNGECSKLFSTLNSDVVLYLEKRFERFEREPVVWFKQRRSKHLQGLGRS